MSSSLDHKCQRCGSQFHGQVCPFCTISGLDVNALLASEGVSLQAAKQAAAAAAAPAPAAAAAPIATTPPAAKAPQTRIIDLSSMKEYPVTPPVCRFGRDISNDIVLTGDKSLSRFHFQITQANDDFLVEDSGSRNGTFLNGSPCTSPRKVLNGDIISAGMSRYRFSTGDEAAPSKNGDGQAAHDSKADKTAAAAAPPSPEPAAAPVTPSPAADAQSQPPAAKEPPKPAAESKPAGKPLAPPSAPSTDDSAVDPLKRLFEEGQALLNQAPPADTDEASVDKLLPGRQDELGDTASRFLKMANRDNQLEQLFPEKGDATKDERQAAGAGDWPRWCTEFTFAELESMNDKADQLSEQIAVKQAELKRIHEEISQIAALKNRLLASRDADMVQACSEVFEKLGWTVKPNAGNANELVLFAGDKAAAIARIVSTDAQPKPSEIANLVSSLSTYWCDHGVEPKGILVVAFIQDGPPQSRPELTADYAQYAAKKNLCLMSSLQMLCIFRNISFKKGDADSIKSELLAASGQLPDFEIS